MYPVSVPDRGVHIGALEINIMTTKKKRPAENLSYYKVVLGVVGGIPQSSIIFNLDNKHKGKKKGGGGGGNKETKRKRNCKIIICYQRQSTGKEIFPNVETL